MTGAPVNCPFCKKPPRFGLGKKTGCSLHGDPMQDVLLGCDNRDCPAKPSVRGGDRYALGETGEFFKRGEAQAREEAVRKWNQCALPQAHLAFIAGTLKAWLLYDASAKAQEGMEVTDDTHIMAPPTWPSHGQLKNWIATLTEPKWKSMENFPVDYREHLFFDGKNVCQGFLQWDKYDGYYYTSTTGSEIKPTHWMHLPDAPTGGES